MPNVTATFLAEKYGGYEGLYKAMMEEKLSPEDVLDAWRKCAGRQWFRWVLDNQLEKQAEVILEKHCPGHWAWLQSQRWP